MHPHVLCHLCAESPLCCHRASAWLSPVGRGTAEGTGIALPAVWGRCAPPGSCSSPCLRVRRSWELPAAGRGPPADGGCGARKCFAASRGERDGPFHTLRTAIVLPFLCRGREGCCLGDYKWHSLINQTGFHSFCPSAGFFVVFFFFFSSSFPIKHPKAFSASGLKIRGRSPHHEWIAPFACLYKHDVVSL